MILVRLLVAALVLGTFADAFVRAPTEPGVSTFGDPPAWRWVVAVAGLLAAGALAAARSRHELARRLALVLVGAHLLGGRLLPGETGWVVVLAGALLAVAAPGVGASVAGLVALAAGALTLPAIATTSFPHGAVLWAEAILPPLALALVLPGLFARDVERPARVLVLVTGAAGIAAALTYLTLASGLDLPLASLHETRLRVFGLHPNLAVPLLVSALVLGLALARTSRGPLRAGLFAAVLGTFVALVAVGSRTGWIGLVLGVGLLLAPRLLGRAAPWATRLAAIGVVALLIVPATGLTDPTIRHRSEEMAAKAVSFRSAMWQMGRDTLAAAPWTGFGPGTSYEQAARARPTRYDGLPKTDHPHNVVLAVGSAFGWPGLLGLGLLLAATLRLAWHPPARGVARGATAALLAMWAANAVDMGGAAQTLYPSLAFVLLAIGETARRRGEAQGAAGRAHESGARDTGRGGAAAAHAPGADAAGRPSGEASSVGSARPASPARSARPASPAPPRPRPALGLVSGLLALLALGLGASRVVARHAQDSARRRLDEAHALELASLEPSRTHSRADAARFDALVDQAETLVARVRATRPTDPNGPLLARDLAILAGDLEAIDAAHEAARALFPRSAKLAFGHARDLLQIDPDDPRIPALLDEAVALDPRGPLVWTRHVERARHQLLTGEPQAALDSLCDALVINPHAIADLPRRAADDGAVLVELADGAPPLRLDAIVDELQARRRTERADDPSIDVRLQMRLVEVLTAAEQFDAAERHARTLEVDVPIYPTIRLATAALAREAPERAVEHFERYEREHGPIPYLSPLAVELEARSRARPLDVEAFEARLARVHEVLPDVLFERDSLRRVLQARRRVAQRSGDAGDVRRVEASLAFLDR